MERGRKFSSNFISLSMPVSVTTVNDFNPNDNQPSPTADVLGFSKTFASAAVGSRMVGSSSSFGRRGSEDFLIF